MADTNQDEQTSGYGGAFTGRPRRRTTRTSVKVIDAVAKYGITAGGLGVIGALALIMVFLVSVVVPLFGDAEVEGQLATDLPPSDGRPVAMALDRNLRAAWTLSAEGSLQSLMVEPADDEDAPGRVTPVATQMLGGDGTITAKSVDKDAIALGFASGKVMLGTIGFSLDYLNERPTELRHLEYGQAVSYDGGVADLTRQGTVRLTKLDAQLADPIDLLEGGLVEQQPITHIDYAGGAGYGGGTAVLAARLQDGRLFWAQSTTKRDMRTGEPRTTLRRYELPSPQRHDADAEVAGLMLGREGDFVFLLFADGHLVWYDATALKKVRRGVEPQAIIAQELDTLDANLSVSAAEMLAGDYTLIVADSEGGVSGWFPAAPAEEGGSWSVEQVHVLEPQPAPITSISVSQRDRQFLTGDADGNVWLRHMTSNTTQAKLDGARGNIVVSATAPSMDAAAVITADGQLAMWQLDNPHADGKLRQLFLPVHYEGRAAESFVYQSSSAGDDAEPKYSLVPLVWGTMKATIYAMLFATPIAILAAIYSSEFMQPGVRSVVKPGIEMMAGLPSVVLGYIAAQVLAPFAEDVLGGLLVTFAAVPVGVMVFGFLWQLVPPSEVNRQGGFWALGGLGLVGLAGLFFFGGTVPMPVVIVFVVLAAILAGFVFGMGEDVGPFMPFIVMAELVLASILLGLALGPAFEAILFGGDLRGWLRGDPSGWVAQMPLWFQAVPGWTLLLTPILTVTLVLVFNLYVRPNMKLFDGVNRSRTQIAVIDLIRFVVIGIVGLLAAAAVGSLFSLIGEWTGYRFDLRSDPLDPLTGGVVDSNGVFGSFDPRNALNVGMIMGFAIIPIIYTVSEDALTAVPNTLRSASLGAGATPWQTAIRVVLPVAISGIFSACMIGLGRAVGETMIVLMAAGNTATMNLNVFDGMRTLAANVATEMPEAPQGGTHYRILFLSGVVLFAMTFLVNTAAEFVRIRFRKRAFQL